MSTLDSNKLVEVSSVDRLTDASSKGYADTVNPSSIGQSGNFLGVSKANGVKWENRNLSVFPNFTLNSITYGNNLYVMCGDGGVVGTSTDTINWTLRTVGSTNYNSIAYYFENYYYVIAGTNQRISTDGISWSLGTSGFGSSAIRSIVYNNNGLYTAAGGGGTIRTSTNLISWTYRTSGFGTSDILSLIYNDGLYFAGGIRIFGTSTDTITWQLRTSGFGTSSIYSIIYGDNLYLAGGTGGTLATSTNGIFWTNVSTTNLSITDRINDLTYGNGLYVYGAYYTANNLIVSSAIATSTDTVNWTFRTAQGIYTDSVRYLKYENNNFFAFPESEPKYVAVSSGDPVWSGNSTESSIQTAPKGFVEYKVPGSYTFTVPPEANNFYIEAVGSGGGGSSSSLTSVTNGKGGGGGAYYANLINRRDLDGAETIGVVVGSKGLGGGNRIDSSTIWNQKFIYSTNRKELYYLNDNYYLLGTDVSFKPTIFSSTDLNAWSLLDLGDGVTINTNTSKDDLTDIFYSYNDSLYLASGSSFGNSSLIAVSTDSINWTFRTSGFGTYQINSITYGNGVYVASGQRCSIATSTDSITWISRTSGVPISAYKYITLTSFQNELFINFNSINSFSGGSSDSISISTDGISWTLRTLSSRTILGGDLNFYYNGSNYIYPTFDNIAFSTDLISWQFSTSITGDNYHYIGGFVYNDNQEYLVLYDNDRAEQRLQFSTDTLTWQIRTCGLNTYTSIAYKLLYANNNYFLYSVPFVDTLPSRLICSTDSINWSIRTLGHPYGSYAFNSAVLSIKYYNGLYLLSGRYNTIAASTDTITWQFRTSGKYSIENLDAYKGYTLSSNSLNYKNGVYSILLNKSPYGEYERNYIAYSTDSIVWSKTEIPIAKGYEALNIAFENNFYHVILKRYAKKFDIPSGCKKIISTDLINWQESINTLQLKNYEQYYNDFKKIGNEYFLVGTNDIDERDIVISSTDFINWSPRTTGFYDYTFNLIYGNGKYLLGNFYFGYDQVGTSMVSTDSINWKYNELPGFYYDGDITFGSFMNNQFVLGGFYGMLGFSTDLINWSYRTNSAGMVLYGGNYERLSYQNGNFILVDDSHVVKSTDGITYETFPNVFPATGYFSSVVYANNLYVANSSGSANICASTDLINWTIRTAAVSVAMYSITYGNGFYVAGGNAGWLIASTDSIHWQVRTSGYGTTTIGYIFYDNNLYISSGHFGIIAVSTDTINWQQRTTGLSGLVSYVKYYNNLYFATADETAFISSTDTIVWSKRTLPSLYRTQSITYGKGIYAVAGLLSGTFESCIYTSTDSIVWSLRTSAYRTIDTNEITNDGNIFALCAQNGYIFTSTDAISWEIRQPKLISNYGDSILDGIYQNGLYVFTNSTKGSVVTSTDTITWDLNKFMIPAGGFVYNSFINYSNNLFLYSDSASNVAVSTDAIYWSLRTFDIRGGVTGDFINSKIYYKNDSYITVTEDFVIVGSTDTITWEIRTSGIDINPFEYDAHSILETENELSFVYNSEWGVPCYILSSTNGIYWKNYQIGYSDNYLPAASNIKKVNNEYFGLTNYSSPAHQNLAVSTDLVIWTLRTLGITASTNSSSITYRDFVNINTSTYGNGIYVIAGVDYNFSPKRGVISTSTDTINWTLRTASSLSALVDTSINSMAFGNNQYVAINGDFNAGRGIIYSTDSITWSSRTISVNATTYGQIDYINDSFLAVHSAELRALTFPVEQGGTSGNASRFNIKTRSILAAGGGNSTFASGGSGGGYPSFPFLVGVNGNNGGDDADFTIPPIDIRKSMGGGAGASGSPHGSAGGLVYNYFYGKEYIISGGSSTGGDGESGVDTGIYLGARGGGGGGAVSSGSNVWTLRTSGFGFSSIRTIIYENGFYLAGGTGGTISTSTNAIAWSFRTSGIGSTSISSLLYANGFYLCAGGNSATIDILRASTDSIVWSTRTTGWSGTTNCSIESLAYGNGFYLAGGVTLFKLIASTDTINWTLRTVGGTGNSYNLRSLNGLYFYVGGGLTVSTDTINWESRTSGFGTSLIYDINYINSSYISVGFGGIISVSTDNINWSRRTSGFGTSTISSISFGNGFYLAGGTGGQILLKSTDTITWTKVISNIPSTSSINNDIIYNGNDLSFITSSGNSIATASALVATWSQRTSGFGATSISALTYGNGFYLAAGTRSLAASTDTINWAFRTSGFGTTFIQTATYGNGFYVVGGGIGTLTVSTNTINWTYRTSGFGVSWIYSLIYDNGFYVASGDTLAVSTDTINWRYRTSGRNGINYLYTSTYGNGFYLTGGFENINASTDTITWIARTSGFGATSISALVYGSGVYVAGGYGATLTTSTDTITWILRTTGLEGTNITSLLYSDGLFVAGSQTANGLFVVSTDAINWEYRVSGFGTSYIGALAYGNNLYVAAGDGITASFSYGYKFAAGKGGDGLYGGGGGGGGLSTGDVEIIAAGGDGGDGYVRITWW